MEKIEVLYPLKMKQRSKTIQRSLAKIAIGLKPDDGIRKWKKSKNLLMFMKCCRQLSVNNREMSDFTMF